MAANTSLTLHSDDWTWNFSVSRDGLTASTAGHRRSLPLPADDVRLCAIPGLSITELEPQPDNGVRVVWGASAALTLRLAGDTLIWHFEAKQPVSVEFPYWTALYTTEAEGVTVRTERSFLGTDGQPIFRHANWPIPAACLGADGTTLTLLLDGRLKLDQLINGVNLGSGSALDGSFTLHGGGWRGAFDVLRRCVRPQADLTEYRREDLAWYRGQWVQHFTFLYGREILNLKTHQFEIERFLAESKRDFGGYDGILLWGVYPRIGVDERTQWDFFDDMPGGRAGLRLLVDTAHAQGVRVFVPYKPWDNSAQRHGQPTLSGPDELARLVREIDADGVFLDTMSSLDPAFRASIDAQRSGVVLCSELRVTPEAFEIITGSWDQSYTRDGQQGNWSAVQERMPGIDLGRFIFPEHRLFVINRHAVGDDRLTITLRGFFGGTGWVVWQDIFGLVLTYSPEEAALLKKCREIFRQHEEALNGATPTPLLPTLHAGVHCNEFIGGGKRFWTFYNDTDHPIDDAVLQIEPRPNTHFVDCWNNRELVVSGGTLCLSLGARSVGAVVELPNRTSP